jgi:hypothetical protein
MIQKYFNFFGTTLSIESEDMSHLSQALNSFRYFESESVPSPQIQIFIENRHRRPGTAIPLFQFRGAKSYGFRNRLIKYPGGHSILLQNRKGTVKAFLCCDENNFLNELLFLTISSLVGWQKESEGWVRLHALSYLKNGSAISYFGDSGIGKSTTAVKYLRSGIPIFSDEITLVSPAGVVHAWPIPVQLTPKTAAELSIDINSLVPFEKRIFATKYQLILHGQDLASPTELQEVRTPHSFLAAIFKMTIGTGLPQIIEMQLRSDNLLNISRIMFRRLKFALSLAAKNKLITSVTHEI